MGELERNRNVTKVELACGTVIYCIHAHTYNLEYMNPP